ncbi:metallophosphoesterase [Salinicola halophyticus]|uniref:metallophosphoesterase n=1 Tax=Salinicola halophyticus TaxID=1808881 RepID=UPI001CB73703|nr:metallophosphoesterase [Salinicola halophyticus]
MRHHRSFLRLRLLLLVLHGYIGWRLLPDLSAGVWGWLVGGGYLLASAIMIPLVVRVTWLNGRWLAWPVALMAGVFSFLLQLTLLRDILLVGWSLVAALSALTVHVSVWVVLAATLLLSGYALWQARRVPRTVEISVPLADLPPALEGFVIVQLSDLHVGPTIKRNHLQRIVERVNSLAPDLVAITGDLTDGRVAELENDVAPLASLNARHGTFCVTGNHEYYSEAEAWIAAFRRLGMRVLINESDYVEHDGAALAVAGITDLSAGYYVASHRSDPAAAARDIPTGMTRILLAHQPNSAPQAAEAGFDLQLSGHTHGGQLWPWSLLARRANRFLAGLGKEGRMWIYTSRGTGYWGPPMRFGAPAEITRIRLTAA